MICLEKHVLNKIFTKFSYRMSTGGRLIKFVIIFFRSEAGGVNLRPFNEAAVTEASQSWWASLETLWLLWMLTIVDWTSDSSHCDDFVSCNVAVTVQFPCAADPGLPGQIQQWKFVLVVVVLLNEIVNLLWMDFYSIKL